LSDESGGSLFNSYSYATIRNCIMWDNSAPNGTEISLSLPDYPSSVSVYYSNIKNGISAFHVMDDCTIVWGDGNIDADPLFADPNNGDYHLKSQAGRFDPPQDTLQWNSDSWVQDETSSPCIDTGDPNSPIGDEPKPNGDRINMGAYGGTWQASISLQEPKLIAHWAFDEIEKLID
jgi:hypothetical protein